MGKKKIKKLSLNRETLRTLSPTELQAMAGGRTGIRMQPHRPGKNALFHQAPSAGCPTVICSWFCGSLRCPSFGCGG